MTSGTSLRGRLFAAIAVLAAIALGACVIFVLDRRPRTHDARLFAYSAGMAPEVSGRITALHVTNNQRVTKGDVLLEIDPLPFELRVGQARAQVAALKAQIALTGRQVSSQGSGAEAAATQVERARTQLAFAHETRSRLEPMVEQGYVTRQQIDEARTNERTAQVALQSAIKAADQAREAVGDTASLEAQLAGAEASEALASRDLREATLRAPFDGTVVGLELAEGSFAVAGHPLFTLIKTDAWYAIADFRETELPRITVGDPATVWTMAESNRAIKGHVESVGAGVQSADHGGPGLPGVGRDLSWVVVAQRFPVWIRLDDPPREAMHVGVTVSVRVQHETVH
ncbi:MAG TPA: HlyD family efflux transporter periplasmic adaptor subunit [Dyella sp.]|jgi:multidrug efflux system membrane fusion protein